MKKSLKQLIGSVIFVCGAIVMFIGISYVLRPLDMGNRTALSGFYAEEDHTLDIVTLGSSGAYRFINNPLLWKEYGITSYNLATGNQQAYMHEMLVNEIMKTQTPDLIIVETRPYVLYNDEPKEMEIRFRRVSDYMNYSLDRIKYINEFTDDPTLRFNLYFDIMFYHGEWEKFDLTKLVNADNNEKLDLKGWQGNFSRVPQNPPLTMENPAFEAINENNERELYEMIEYCEQRGIQLVFVATPWQMTESRIARYRYLEDILAKKGYALLNCNDHVEEIGLDYNTDFGDPKHTNTYGAEKVTRFIADYIVENYELDLTHTKRTKKEWDKVWQVYCEEKVAAEQKALEKATEEKEPVQSETGEEDEEVDS